MAGGKGERLKPVTNILPKPLVPIGEKTIIEHIFDKFLESGSTDFYLTLKYKSRLIKAYFEESNNNYMVNFIEEEKPLGTAGSLHKLKNTLKEPFFVTNCDVIINTDYNSLYDFHKNGGYDLSLVASAKEYVIFYGTCELDSKGSLSNLVEKPSYDFLVNTGLYVLNPDVLSFIPENQYFDITN